MVELLVRAVLAVLRMVQVGWPMLACCRSRRQADVTARMRVSGSGARQRESGLLLRWCAAMRLFGAKPSCLASAAG